MEEVCGRIRSRLRPNRNPKTEKGIVLHYIPNGELAQITIVVLYWYSIVGCPCGLIKVAVVLHRRHP